MINNLPVWKEVDTLVLGGGPAGFSAAVAAAQIGAKTLLVEQYGFLGGMATAALVMPWNVWAKPVTSKDIGGVYRRLVQALERKNATYCYSPKTVLRSFDPAMLKITMDELALEAGIDLLFHTIAVDVVKKGSLIDAVVLQSKAGRGVVKAKTFVDATGDGDVAVRAGAPFRIGSDDSKTQPGTLIFMMGGVDILQLTAYLKQNREELENWPPNDEIRFGDGEHICVSGFFEIIRRAKADGVPLIGDQLILTSTPTKGLLTINITKVYGIDLDDPMSLSRAETEARKQISTAKDFLNRYIPGFKSAYLVDIAVQIGIRETRRIKGDVVIKIEDVQNGRSYPDRVARLFNVGHVDFTGIDEHGNKIVRFDYLTKELQIPFGSILAQGLENLCVGGRCISSDSKVFGYIRTQTACFATGEAAGTVAALAALGNCGVRNIDLGSVQETLVKGGMDL